MRLAPANLFLIFCIIVWNQRYSTDQEDVVEKNQKAVESSLLYYANWFFI
jgi:hypothetical protein